MLSSGFKSRARSAPGLARPAQPRKSLAATRVLERAGGLEQQGQRDEAAAFYETALATQPDHFGALFLPGIIRYRQGRTGEALLHFTAAVKNGPGQCDGLVEPGRRLPDPDAGAANRGLAGPAALGERRERGGASMGWVLEPPCLLPLAERM